MGQDVLKQMFESVGAIVTGSHIVYAKKEKGWFHGEAYVNKDAISMHPRLLWTCTDEMIKQLSIKLLPASVIDVIAAPAAGAIGWGQMLANELCCRVIRPQPLFVFAEKEKDTANPDDYIFVFRQIFRDVLAGKNVLVAEDITNPGTSAKKVAKAVEACGGKVIGVSVLCNRVGQQAHDYLAPWPLFAVADVTMDMWHENECPLCLKSVPLNMTLGKAKDWLATEKGQAWAAKNMK